jgi:hypothetical protein
VRVLVIKPFFLPALVATIGLIAPALAEAQFSRRDPATGEVYAVEIAYGWWKPTPTISFSSELFDIPGTVVDFERDLGILSQRLSELRVALRPARKHKFRVDYLPIGYSVEGHLLTREIIFNGQVFTPNIPVNVEADWDTWKVGYEYDFIYRDRGYVGVTFDVKYTKASIDFESPVTSEFARASAPIPGIGAVGRGYLARNVAVTGEFSWFKIPDSESRDYSGHYYDFDFYGTINFNRNVGVIGGWRRLDLGYIIELDAGDLDMTGLYFLGVVRF